MSTVCHDDTDLSTFMSHVLADKTTADLQLKCGGATVDVHSNIVCRRSPVFSAMMKHECKEKAEGTIELKETAPVVMTDMVDYMYTGKIKPLQEANPDNFLRFIEGVNRYLDLAKAAHLYQMPGMKKYCEDNIVQLIQDGSYPSSTVILEENGHPVRMCRSVKEVEEEYFKEHFRLCDASKALEMPLVKKASEHQLIARIKRSTVLSLAILADDQECPRVRAACVNFIVNNISKVVKVNNNWKDIIGDRPAIMLKIIEAFANRVADVPI